MVRKDLVQAFRKTGLTIREAALCIDALAEWMEESLISGNSIELRGIGSFSVKQVADKKVKLSNTPKTLIPAHKKIVFRPSGKLKAAVREQHQ